MAEPKEFVVKTREQIRTDYTRTVAAGLVELGIPNANVSEGTLDYLRGDALGAFGEDIGNLVQIKADASMIDSAGKTDPEELRRHSRIVKLDLRPAGPAIGFANLETSTDAAVGIPTGAQLLSASGLTFETLVPGPYVDGDPVQIRSLDTGEGANLEAGETLRWVNPPPFVKQTCLVATGGLVGGVNQEDVEGLRERLTDYYANPPGGGNWSQVRLVAESSTTFVGKAYVYMGVYGGNTFHVAVVRAPTATNKSRAVAASVIAEYVRPAVLAEFPTFADITVTTTTDYPVDASFNLSIPSSRRAVPPGPGGGWYDANPWPRPITASGFASVVSFDSPIEFVVRAEGTPAPGARIAYVSPFDFKLYRGIVQTVSRDDAIGFPNDWRITVDVGFFAISSSGAPIAPDDWVFPDAENLPAYVASVLASFATVGPAEKTSIVGLLPRALRKPSATTSNPSRVGPFALRQLVLSGSEVLDASYLVTPATVPVASGYQVPPNIATPRRIAFYAAE